MHRIWHLSVALDEQVVTTDARVTVDVWRPMVLTAVNRSFNQITVCPFDPPFWRCWWETVLSLFGVCRVMLFVRFVVRCNSTERECLTVFVVEHVAR